MYQAAQWVSTHSLPPVGESNDLTAHHQTSRGGSPLGLRDKKGKKEVSFSLEEALEKDGAEGDPDTSGSLGSVFTSPIPATQDNNNLKSPMEGQFLTFTSGKTSPGCRSGPSCYESSSDRHTYANTPPIAETDDRMHMQLDKPGGEDALSASSGETGTDSGRGGSEDEAHTTHRGSSTDTDPRTFHLSQPQGTTGYSSFTGADRGRRKPPSLSSLPEEHHHLHTSPTDRHLQPQHNYFRSSSEQLPTHGLGYPSGCARNFSFNAARDNASYNPARDNDRDNARDIPDGYHSMDRKGGEGPFRLRDTADQQAGRRTFHTFGHQHTNQQTHPAWRRAKGLDGGWRSATSPTPTTTTYTDDDEKTTTSGSYTLTPEEASPADTGDVPFHQIHDIMV
ncbi:hypothetical protein ACOMHN_045270 [Nucella lapillus]